MAIIVRKAGKSDMPTVLKFMKDLAAALNEKEPKLTVEELYRDGGFDGNFSYFFVLLAEDTSVKDPNGFPQGIGFALSSHLYSWDGRTIYMRNLYVEESYRSKGIGKIIFEELLKHAKRNGCNRVELHVSEWNSAHKFYQKMGAINVSKRNGFIYYRLYKDVINNVL